MELNGEPANALFRRYWWSDAAPRWMNRLAHLICFYLTSSALAVPLLIWLRGRSINQALEAVGVGAMFGAMAYAIGLAVYQVGRWRARGR